MADGPAGRDWLSRTLRELRVAAKMSGVQAAAAAGLSQSRLSRIESGVFAPAADEITRLCALYRAPAATRRRLLAARRAIRPGQSSARVVISRGSWKMQRRIGQAEENAAEICGYTPTLVNGLLQTAAYARLVLGGGGDVTGGELDKAVDARMARAAVLDSGRRMVLIMAEGALRWQAGSAEIMAGQLEHISAVIRSHPRARIGIIPQSQPACVFPTHGFSVYDRRVVIVGVWTGTSFISDADDVAEYVKLFAELESLAVFGGEAIRVVSEIAASYRPEAPRDLTGGPEQPPLPGI
jgi:transcriptional regulator with XRE-family HTH domain